MRTCHPHYCSLLSTRSCWLHSCILSATFLTASSFAFLASLSLRPCPGCADYWCASCAPPDRLLLDLLVHLRVSRSSVLSGALCCFRQRHIPHTLVWGEPPRVSWFEHPTERYDSRDRSLWLFAVHVSSNGLPDALTASFTVQSYPSAHLRCAAYVSRVSACWLYS